MRLGISEILSRVSKLSTDQEKIEFLRQNQSAPLCSILKNFFDETIKFILPEGAPPYKPNPYPGQELRLFAENRRLYLFIEGQSPNINRIRREQLFIEILEAVSPQDALLLIAMKDKTMPYEGITGKVVAEAFPGLIVSLKEEKDETPNARSESVRKEPVPTSPKNVKGTSGVRRGKSQVQVNQDTADVKDDEERRQGSEEQPPAAS